jgi:predicted alpha/beta hydrolase family esterase
VTEAPSVELLDPDVSTSLAGVRSVFELFAWAFVFVASGFVGSILVYAVGSFALMRPYTATRTLRVSLRELTREAVLAVVTQPLLPLYYLYGHRMEWLARRPKVERASKVPVVFVHGYMQNRVGFVGLARALASRGIGPLFGFNYPWFASLESNARRLERFVERVCNETGSAAVDLVCHSMGGLVAMEMLHDEAHKQNLKVRRCVTIATPHAGVAWRGPLLGVGATSLRRGSKLLEAQAGYTLALPTLSIFSSHDNVVHPKETAYLVKRGGRDVEVEGIAHLAILFSRPVAEHVAAFLLEPGPPAPEARVSATDAPGSEGASASASARMAGVSEMDPSAAPISEGSAAASVRTRG